MQSIGMCKVQGRLNSIYLLLVQQISLTTLCQKWVYFYFLNIPVKNESILTTFGVRYPEEIWHWKIVNFPTSPAYCSHCTWGKSKIQFSTALLYMHPIVWVIIEYLSQYNQNHNYLLSSLLTVSCYLLYLFYGEVQSPSLFIYQTLAFCFSPWFSHTKTGFWLSSCITIKVTVLHGV